MSEQKLPQVPPCRVCGCTDDDCRQCIEATGIPCYWTEPGLCSACSGKPYPAAVSCTFKFDDDPKEFEMKFDTDLTAGHEEEEAKGRARAALKELQWEEAVLVAITFTKAQPKPAEPDSLEGWELVRDDDEDHDYTTYEEVE